MPSVWSAVTPDSTAFGLATLDASTSVIALSVLPLATLQSEPGDQDGGEQEWNHGGSEGGALAEVAATDGTLVSERRHQMRGVGRTSAGEHPDELEIGKREQHREGHHHGDDWSEQRVSDIAKSLPGRCAVDGRGLIERRRYGLQSGEQRDGDERHSAPDVGEDHRPSRIPGIAEEIDIARDQADLAQRPGHDRELAVVNPPERDRREHGRHDERN